VESAWYIKGLFGSSEVSQAKGYQSKYVLCGKMSVFSQIQKRRINLLESLECWQVEEL
jgi:hypothetical protein